MPYRHANYFVGFTLFVIILGFWDSYFVPIAQVPLAFHVHAFTATSWVILLMFQHWSIHGGSRKAHRIAGRLSLALFPFLIVGFVMIIDVSAKAYAANESPVASFLGPSFGLSMLFAIIAYLVLYYQALRNRRNVILHAGYMLTTPLVLFESPFSRIVIDHLPFLIFTGSDFPQRILDSIVISMAMAIAFALVIYLRDRRHGMPFLVAAGIMFLQAVSMYFGTSLDWVRHGFVVYAEVPTTATVLVGLLLGAAVSWFGWRPVKRSSRREVQAPIAS
jgi:hypothetical protein